MMKLISLDVIQPLLSFAATWSLYYLLVICVLVLFLPRRAQKGALMSLSWFLWVLFSLFAITFQWCIVVWTSIRLTSTILFYANIRLLSIVSNGIISAFQRMWRCRSRSGVSEFQQQQFLEETLAHAENYQTWRKIAVRLDNLDNMELWRDVPDNELEHELMLQQIDEIRKLRDAGDIHELMSYLRSIMTRSNCHMNNPSLYQTARVGTKNIIHEFLDEVSSTLREISCISPDDPFDDIFERLEFFKTARHSFGRTALCLSGGGSLSMYHIGVVKSLKELSLLPDIISGTSGGSIVAGILAVHTDDELDQLILRPEVASFRGVKWFEPLNTQILKFLSNGVIMENEFFAKAVQAYYEDYTFAEAYKRTGRIVNIVLTHSSSTAKSKMILMNYISSPHVLIRSAVHASCALPGLMRPVELLAKDRKGAITSYMPGSFSKFIDGSLKADIPMRRLSELFNVTQCIVSQVNPHISPFLRRRTESVEKLGFMSRLEYMTMLDLKACLRKLAKLRLIPKIFGHDVSEVFTQKYRGDINILPRISFVDNFNVLSHPELDDMKRYIRGGAKSVWPVVSQIESLCAIENMLKECHMKLKSQIKSNKDQHSNLPKSPSMHFGHDSIMSLLCESCVYKLMELEKNEPQPSMISNLPRLR